MLRPIFRSATKRYLRSKFSKPPIILGGAPRTGTTLLLSILGSHDEIYAIDYETTAFHPRERPEKLLSALVFENESRTYRHIPSMKTCFCEKTPGNIRHVDEINAFFNNEVKFINIFRDGRDVITSRHPLDPDKYWAPIERWIFDTKCGLEADRLDNVFSLKYENLVTDTEQSLREITDFLELPFQKQMLEYHNNTNVKRNLAWEGRAKQVSSNSLQKWKRPEHREIVENFMANEEALSILKRLDYEV
jgi:hypothetical protein